MKVVREKECFYIGTPEQKDAYITFIVQGEILTVEHTVVSDKLKGQGAGKLLVKEIATYVRENGWRVKSTCPFAKAIFQKNEEYKDILA